MTREEEITNAAREYNDSITLLNPSNVLHFEAGAKWADENPNKKLVYTKKELLNMGFGFDLNGNIVTLQEIEEMTRKYINYRKGKWVKNACEWIKNNKHLYEVLSFGSLSIDWDKFIVDFHKAMED